MQSQNRIFEDIAKLANGAAGTFAGAAREVEAKFKERVQRAMGGMDFVSRDEFEAVKEMAATARAEATELRARLDAMSTPAATPKRVTRATKAAA
jgi:BMFP domain-containing protein YqiC